MAQRNEFLEDFGTHKGSWRAALIAAHAADPQGGWDRELNVFDQAYGHYVPGMNPAGVFGVHQARWRQALEIAHAKAEVNHEERIDDKSYWSHELQVFDRSFQVARALLSANEAKRVVLPRSGVDVEFLDRLNAIPKNWTFACYAEALMPEESHSEPVFLQFDLDAPTLWNIAALASGARDLDAKSISMTLSPFFSDRSIRSDSDSLVILPTSHLPTSIMQYLARLDETDLIVESPMIDFDTVLVRIEDAVVEERTEVWLSKDAEDRLVEAQTAFESNGTRPSPRP